MPEAFFTVDGGSYVPGPMTRGPWGAAMGGQIVGGLLGWGIEQSGLDPDFQPARLTVDLLRPALLLPVQIQTSVLREGRRIRLLDATLIQRDTIVARASALFLRRGAHPDGQVWSAPVEMPPLPTRHDGFPADMPFHIWGYGATLEGSPGISAGEWQQSHAQKFAWARLFRPMVQGHPLTPFTRLAFAGDITSSVPLGHRRIALHQCRLHGHRQPTARRRISGAGRAKPLRHGRCGHRHRNAVRPPRPVRCQLRDGRRSARRRVQADPYLVALPAP